MSKLKIIATMCIIALVAAFSSGCTGSVGENAIDTEMQSSQIASQTEIPQSGSTGEYTIGDSLPSDIRVDLSANKVSDDAILVTYNLDLTSMGTAMEQKGWDVLITAYAYNPGVMESGFSVNSYDDIISGGIPYKTRSIHIFPSNVYPDKIEVSINPGTGMAINTEDFYTYGVVLREA